jgi:D-alanyl-D-alanine carboxypeptidase (penicillin-binding protein 5/6)
MKIVVIHFFVLGNPYKKGREGMLGNFFKAIFLYTIFSLVFNCIVFAELKLDVKSAVLMDPQNGRILLNQNGDLRLPPASVTKVMTMLLIMEEIDNGKISWNDRIPTTAIAAGMGGSQVFLKEGEELSLKEMLKAIAVVSANDASTAVAEYLYGSAEEFIDQMNLRARQLRLKNTHFVNETGLPDPDHYSSAYDLAAISRELVQHPKILEFTSIWMDSLRGGKFTLKNTNDLIRVYAGADGLKTGHTDEAKFCLSATARRKGFRLLSVIMGASSNAMRISETRRLLDYGFRNYELKTLAGGDKVIGRLYNRTTKPERIPVKVKRDFGVLVKRGEKQPITTRLQSRPALKLPLKAGQVIGYIKAIKAGKEIGRMPVYTTVPVKKANLWTLGWRTVRDFFLNLFGRKKQ